MPVTPARAPASGTAVTAEKLSNPGIDVNAVILDREFDYDGQYVSEDGIRSVAISTVAEDPQAFSVSPREEQRPSRASICGPTAVCTPCRRTRTATDTLEKLARFSRIGQGVQLESYERSVKDPHVGTVVDVNNLSNGGLDSPHADNVCIDIPKCVSTYNWCPGAGGKACSVCSSRQFVFKEDSLGIAASCEVVESHETLSGKSMFIARYGPDEYQRLICTLIDAQYLAKYARSTYWSSHQRPILPPDD